MELYQLLISFLIVWVWWVFKNTADLGVFFRRLLTVCLSCGGGLFGRIGGGVFWRGNQMVCGAWIRTGRMELRERGLQYRWRYLEFKIKIIVSLYYYFFKIIDDDDLDRQGVARISDALQAHMWPDMTMKNKKGTVYVQCCQICTIKKLCQYRYGRAESQWECFVWYER